MPEQFVNNSSVPSNSRCMFEMSSVVFDFLESAYATFCTSCNNCQSRHFSPQTEDDCSKCRLKLSPWCFALITATTTTRTTTAVTSATTATTTVTSATTATIRTTTETSAATEISTITNSVKITTARSQRYIQIK